MINTVECYRSAEQKAADYFKSLYQQIVHKTYVQTLTKDFQSWKRNHIHHHSLLSCFGRNKKPDPLDYHRYIEWLDYTGKLDNYLDRSISYIFMRDLGKALNSLETRAQVRRVVDNLKDYLTDPAVSDEADGAEKTGAISMAGLYRRARKEGIASTMIWVMDKLKTMSAHIPQGMDAGHAERKLIKIIAGVLMHAIEEMGDNTPPEERARKLDKAIRLGYSYGLTYPFIDDLLDANVLSLEEKNRYSDLIRTALVTGSAPELDDWTEQNSDLAHYVHSELAEAFEYIKSHQQPENLKLFFEQAYVFFNSQEVDRMNDLSNPNYTNGYLFSVDDRGR